MASNLPIVPACALWAPVTPGTGLFQYPCDMIAVDTDAAQIAFEPADDLITQVNNGVFTRLLSGDFAAATGWGFTAGWSIGSGKLTHAAAGGTGDAYQNNMVPTGAKACVVWDLIWRAGTGGITPKLGTGVGTQRAATGTYTDIITSATNGNLIFTPGNTDNDCDIDNVAIYPVTIPLSNKQPYAFRAKRILAVTSGVVYVGWYPQR